MNEMRLIDMVIRHEWTGEEVDAFLDSLDLMTIQRAWDRQVARLKFVTLPPLDDDQ
jgi:hypothetical protein